MKTIYSDEHRHQDARGELHGGRFVPPFEKPARADMIIQQVREADLGEVIAPDPFERAAVARVHGEDYLTFLETCWEDWKREYGTDTDALPSGGPVRTMRNICPRDLEGRLCYYTIDITAPITEGTWRAITASASVAVTGARLIHAGESAAFSLCRPPGHHAARDLAGGYCFLNNAAIVAEWFRDKGAGRVAILDVDYHHGNGTQAIFYDRPDVLFLSIHCDPRDEYPFFLGFADEQGEGVGEGANVNYPLPPATAWAGWSEALESACRRAEAFAPDVLIVSLGVDTFERDPISQFRLTAADYPRIGERIARMDLPTHFVMEGGYAVEEIGVNTVGVLTGYENAARR